MNSIEPAVPHDSVARAAITVETAVTAARLLIADAADIARDGRANRHEVAADLAADQAAQDATATRYREDAAATEVHNAAEVADQMVLGTEPDPIGPAALQRASAMAARVQAAAVAVASANAALALAVANAVALRAELVAASRRSLDEQSEVEIEATAAAIEVLAREAAADLAVA
ncbi:hypothetical protein [Nocardioides sp. WS12]|uniref:hypothetical protein n=1 Tax=Nocardioides sp. WS12 TaxID=2486272 RepID=UPI0015FD65FD|nr:hypothetical protein [Nocardioides sp. WS12]